LIPVKLRVMLSTDACQQCAAYAPLREEISAAASVPPPGPRTMGLTTLLARPRCRPLPGSVENVLSTPLERLFLLVEEFWSLMSYSLREGGESTYSR
jgi:hypothetical protein